MLERIRSIIQTTTFADSLTDEIEDIFRLKGAVIYWSPLNTASNGKG